MKEKPLPLNSVVHLCPWIQFSLGMFTSFGRLSRLRYFALSSLYEGKSVIQKSCLNQVKSVNNQTRGPFLEVPGNYGTR